MFFLRTILSLMICFSSCVSYVLSEEVQLEQVPTLFKGRIRPLDAMAKLWLEDYYHHNSIKSDHFNAFHVPGPSALALLWKIQFTGYQNWTDIPMFWIYSSRLKELLDIPLNHNYFSYQDLSKTIYENPKNNLSLMKEIIVYSFLKSYLDGNNHSFKHRLELQQLSPGLWVIIKNNELVLESVPQSVPWHFLKAGDIITQNVAELSPDYLKQHRALYDEILGLLQELQQFSRLDGPYAFGEKEYEATVEELNRRQISSQQIEEVLEQQYPLYQRLKDAGTLFKVLPAKNGEWYSLNALTLKNYSPEKQNLEPISNFTIYPDAQFEKIRNLYFQFINDYDDAFDKKEMAELLLDNYALMIGQPFQVASDKSLTYPSIEKLKIEYLYYQLPFTETTIALYGLAIIFLTIGLNQKKRRFTHVGTFFALVAFGFNTLILALRCYVLGRPPVSNMFETVIYVPWIAVLVSFILVYYLKNSFILLSSSLVALILLILLKATGLGGSLENVQAVLDSQFWLTIHVLMIVGSYGVFALAGILGQLYLFQYIIHESETYEMKEMGKAILQSLYIGVALLIPGTILGGVWAAQSWGRFWDWDPKESWAFISGCVYLIFIHAFRFGHIRYFGLAMGSILGLLAISFTWYGVNYILGTGLHSYGFGSGGEIYYYLFVLAELLFISFAGIFHLKLTKVEDSR